MYHLLFHKMLVVGFAVRIVWLIYMHTHIGMQYIVVDDFNGKIANRRIHLYH